MNKTVIFDGRNLSDQYEIESAGIDYFAIGKSTNGLKKLNNTQKDSSYSGALLQNGV